MTPTKRPYRLRSLHRKMSPETWERTVPFRAGWKREYYGGAAHVRPSWATCIYELALTPRPVICEFEIRTVTVEDRPALLEGFIDAFRYAPEYCSHTMSAYRRAARDYFDGFFGDNRGRWSPTASCCAVDGDRILAAALIKERESSPLLDCVYARPDRFRKGLATAVTAFAGNRLVASGERKLKSCALLANDASTAWHSRYGFVELPNWMTAQSRYFNAVWELERLRKWKLIAPEEEVAALAELEIWKREYERIEALKESDFRSAMPMMD